MGTITVQTGFGSVNFKIAGDRPTVNERMRINEVVANPRKFLPSDFIKGAEQKRKGIFEGFDYETGIRDTDLRAALSLAESPAEEEAQLSKFGLTQEDFVRDPRGALALTPSGAAKFGIESEKNVVVDETGLSRADISDFAGFVPELSGAIAGAVAGQAVIPVPIVGAAIGAALGGGGGSLLEEAYEGVTGTSKQTAGEIAKDALTEAAIAGTGEALFGLVAKGFGAVARGSMPKGLTEDTLRAFGESREFGITPAAGQVGAGPLISRTQAVGEQVFRGSPRTAKNNEAILSELTNLRSVAGTSDPVELGRILMEASKTANNTVKMAEKNAARSVLKAARDMADDLGRASQADKAIDEDLFSFLKTSYQSFDNMATTKFSSIDAALEDAVGNSEIIPTGQIASQAKQQLRKFKGSVPAGSVADTKSMLQNISSIGPNSSFSQLYNARKSLNDLMMANPGKNTIQQYGEPILQQLDAVLKSSNIEDALTLAGRSLDPAGIDKVRAAAKDLGDARSFYKEGMRQFEEIRDIANINAIRNEIRNGVRVNPAGLADRLIKPNNPELLRRAEKVLEDVRIDGGDFEGLKQRIAGEWIRRNIGESVNDLDPRKFRGSVFKQKLDKLGSTADELFGEVKARQLRNLADQLDATSLTNVDQSVINRVQEIIGSQAPDINLLRNLAAAQRDAQEVTRNRLMRKLASENMDEMEAASLIASSGTRPDDINRIMKYFADSNAAKEKIRSYYMETIIGDFGDTFITDPTQLKAFGKRLEKEYKTGKLGTVFGEEMAERMNKFGRVLTFNSKTVEAGGIVAANIATSPLKNIGKLARYSILGRLLSSDLFYKNIDKQYRMLTQGATSTSKARALGQLIAQGLNSAVAQATTQGLDEGIREVSREAQALLNVYDNQIRSQEQSRRAPPMPAPQVSPGGIGAIAAPGPRSNGQQGIREQAAQNPAVAASLLGGLGSASLLNR